MYDFVKTKFGVKIDKHWPGAWSFGICLSHMNPETYIFINFAKWSISVGWLAYIEDSDLFDADWEMRKPHD